VKFNFSQCQNVLIVGAGHGIGLSLVELILKNYPHIQVFATYRLASKALKLFDLQKTYDNKLDLFEVDPTIESSYINISHKFNDHAIKLNLIVNCVGLLHNEIISPEKSLRSFNPDHFLEVMRVNTVVAPLIAKYFQEFWAKEATCVFVTLSAKVGSIEDNRLGGWYSYRASKAALNMLIKNISIEFFRKRNNCVVLALHPGTTETNLSTPFLANTSHKVHTPDETAKNLIEVISNTQISDSGKFLSWNGDEIVW